MTQTIHERAITGEIIVSASQEQVWQTWTTEEGTKTFFAPGANIDLEVNGRYEILFNLEAEPGSQGGEGMKILAIQPPEMLSITWNAPPHLASVRGHMTHLLIRLEPINDSTTRVRLHHAGWGKGGEWDQAYDYFTFAWLKLVLPRLQYRFEHGPIDWDNVPDLG